MGDQAESREHATVWWQLGCSICRLKARGRGQDPLWCPCMCEAALGQRLPESLSGDSQPSPERAPRKSPWKGHLSSLSCQACWCQVRAWAQAWGGDRVHGVGENDTCPEYHTTSHKYVQLMAKTSSANKKLLKEHGLKLGPASSTAASS